jgi:hypothetical protein
VFPGTALSILVANILLSADGSILDVADNRVLLAAADMVSQFDGVPSTAEGLRQAHDALHYRMQANVHEMRVLLAQQQLGYTEMLDLQARLRELEAEEDGEDEVEEGVVEESDE